MKMKTSKQKRPG